MELEYLNKCNLCKSEDIFMIDKDCNIFKCNYCGYIFDNPRPTFDEIENFYSKEDQYDSWIKEEKGRDILWQRRLKMVKRYKNSGTLLDIGAGIGQFLYFAKNDFEVEGTEISESAIKIAKEKYDLNLIKGQVEDIDFNGQKFDLITLFHVLEHVTHPSQLIEKCYNLLNKQGVLVISVPNDINSVKRILINFLSILQIKKFRKYGKLGLAKLELDNSLREIHLSHFTASSLKRFLIKNNFTVIEDTLDPYYAATGIKKIIQDSIYYFFLIVIKKIFNSNLYNTIWIAAKRE